MPVDFAVYYKNGNVDSRTLWVMDTTEQTISFPNTGGEIDFALFDEESKVMKKMDFQKPLSELMAQASKAKHMIDRYDAVAAMSTVALNEKMKFLQTRFSAEKHPAIRAEIAKQLANWKILNKWYVNIVKDAKSEVKNAFIAADTNVMDQKEIFVMLLSDSSNVVVENTLDKLMLCKELDQKDKVKYLKMTEQLSGQNNNIRAKWLEYAVMNIYVPELNDSYSKELTRLCSPLYEFRTRVNAANALKRLGFLNEEIAANLIEASLTYNSRLAGPCAAVLKELKKGKPENAILQTEINKLSNEQQAQLKSMGLKD
jgi:hypothetical protein